MLKTELPVYEFLPVSYFSKRQQKELKAHGFVSKGFIREGADKGSYWRNLRHCTINLYWNSLEKSIRIYRFGTNGKCTFVWKVWNQNNKWYITWWEKSWEYPKRGENATSLPAILGCMIRGSVYNNEEFNDDTNSIIAEVLNYYRECQHKVYPHYLIALFIHENPCKHINPNDLEKTLKSLLFPALNQLFFQSQGFQEVRKIRFCKKTYKVARNEESLTKVCKKIFGNSGSKTMRQVTEFINKGYFVEICALHRLGLSLDDMMYLLKENKNSRFEYYIKYNIELLLSTLKYFKKSTTFIEFFTSSNFRGAFIKTDSYQMIHQIIQKEHIEYDKRIKDFQQLHDVLSYVRNRMGEKEIALPVYTPLANTTFSFKDDIYHVVFPRTNLELKQWGQHLDNCVGSYAHRVTGKQSIICGLTDKHNQLTYCIEFDNNVKLNQFSGKRNKDVDVEMRKAFEKQVKQLKLTTKSENFHIEKLNNGVITEGEEVQTLYSKALYLLKKGQL
jgi:hypothetical protein